MPLHLSLPDKPTFEVGLEPARLVITTDPELEAVVLAMPQMDLELVLSTTSTIDMILKVIDVLDRLQGGDGPLPTPTVRAVLARYWPRT